MPKYLSKDEERDFVKAERAIKPESSAARRKYKDPWAVTMAVYKKIRAKKKRRKKPAKRRIRRKG